MAQEYCWGLRLIRQHHLTVGFRFPTICFQVTPLTSLVHSILFYGVHSPPLKKTRRKSTRFTVVFCSPWLGSLKGLRELWPQWPCPSFRQRLKLYLSRPVLQLPDSRELSAHHPQALGTPGAPFNFSHYRELNTDCFFSNYILSNLVKAIYLKNVKQEKLPVIQPCE